MATYKNILDIILRNGCNYVEINSNEVISFMKYVERRKVKSKLYFYKTSGKVKVSKQPIVPQLKTN